jgi:SAM-dependent methyltransferase
MIAGQVERAEQEASHLAEIAGALADASRLRRIVFSKPLGGKKESVQKAAIRPVELKGKAMFQLSLTHDTKKVIVRNLEMQAALEELGNLARGRFLHVAIVQSDATIRFDSFADGRTRRTESAPESTNAPVDLGHDRRKSTLLTVENAREVLSVLGFLAHGGGVKPSMQKKFRQVNEFVRALDDTSVSRAAGTETLHVVDCGCGNAYLTFALFHFLARIRSRSVILTGIDRDPDAVARNNGKARVLGVSGIGFVHSPISTYDPPVPPDIVLSLHACDTASDEAIARAIYWKSRLVLCAPCCHHHVNVQLKKNHDTIMTRSLARHGILVEKMGDVLTDLFRVLILSVMGYRVSTIKFVDPDNTERNTLIKAEVAPATGDRSPAVAAAQYRDVKAFWNVTPFLEEALGSLFREKLDALSRE